MALLQRVLISFIALAGCDSADTRIEVTAPPNARIAFGASIYDGIAVGSWTSVPEEALAVSLVEDVGDDGHFDAETDRSMPCTRLPSNGWQCEPAAQRVIVRSINRESREVIVAAGRWEIRACAPASPACVAVPSTKQGDLEVIRECGVPFQELVALHDGSDERIMLRDAMQRESDIAWNVSGTWRDDIVEFRLTSMPIRVIASAQLWTGRTTGNSDDFAPLAPALGQVNGVKGTDGSAARLRLDRATVNNCLKVPDCEIWAGVAVRTIVDRALGLRIEQLADYYVPLLHLREGTP